MEELYLIMSDFLEVEYNQDSLLCLLTAAEAAFPDELQAEGKLINSTKYYLKALQEELRTAINKMDSYIVENAKKQ